MAPAISVHHAEWLSLVETSGPFLSVPVLSRALPQGLDAPDRTVTTRMREARTQLAEDQTLHRAWCEFVLHDVLEFEDAVVAGPEIPPGLEHRASEQGEVVRPDLVVVDRSTGAPQAVLLVTIHPPTQQLERRLADAAWSASPIDRIAALCRAAQIPLGLTTNGRSWTLVWARPGESTGVCTWDAELWLEEPLTLRAFRTLLGAHRFFTVAADETLPKLLKESAQNQQEVTDRLGAQVREAVELLIDALDRADHDRHGQLLGEIANEELYRAAVTVMMRVVFLFVAEERRLLPLDDPLYAQSYAASTLREQLEERATRFGEDPLERSAAAWHRLLALFRAVHGGIEHEALRLPAYGGGLFDPDRYPFLEGRHEGSSWHDEASRPLPVDDRTVLHLLTALQVLEEPGRAGQPRAAVRLSFRALDVEQIGHVYEGLLDHTAVRTFDAAVGLVGKEEEEIAITELERARDRGEDALIDVLKERTKKTPRALRKVLTAEPDPDRAARLLAVSDNNPTLRDRLLPFLGLIRDDLRGDPRVFLPGALYVTKALERRSSGTYYTPRALAEEVVKHALDPIAYAPGPADEADAAQWYVRPAQELLELKVVDITMGSGAFLVAACRYLAARLLEAWDALDRDQTWTVFGRPRGSTTGEAPLPADPAEREVLAHRVITERCLYGVDRNPMAVEMAKLSLWLVTLAKDRPFSFLDHALREGDSLLGVTELDQVRALHIDPERGRELHQTLLGHTTMVGPAVGRALALRAELESFVVRDVRDARRKADLNALASGTLNDVRLLADVIVGAALASDDPDTLDAAVASIEVHVPSLLDPDVDESVRTSARQSLQDASQRWLQSGRVDLTNPRRCFHWPLEMPEVTATGGFDAIVGNPPFRGGVDLARTLGVDYEGYLKRRVPAATGFVDLAVYFHRRGVELTRPGGVTALLGPQNLTAAVNRRPGAEEILASGRRIFWARDRVSWPGSAAVEVCIVCYGPDHWKTPPILNQVPVASISASLDSELDLTGIARLRPWVTYSQGTDLYGRSFIKTTDEWLAIADDPEALARYLRHYVNAEILCEQPEQQSELVAPDFGEAERAKLQGVEDVVAYLAEHVGHERANQTRQIHEHRPWLFWDKRLVAYAEARQLDRVLVCPNLSKYVPMVFTTPGHLFSKGLKFLVTDDAAVYGWLQSSMALAWIAVTSPMRESRIAFSTRNSLDTLVQPQHLDVVRDVAERHWEERRIQMTEQRVGITQLLNRMHDSADVSEESESLRERHTMLDYAVWDAYGWAERDLGHGFHATRQGIRYTVHPAVRQEALNRLVTLNSAARLAEDGLPPKGKRKRSDRKRGAKTATSQTVMFDNE